MKVEIDDDRTKWAPSPLGDGCGFMAWPISEHADGLWEVVDCEGDRICVCLPETAVLLHLLLNQFEASIPDGPGVLEYLRETAREMVDGNAGMGGSWEYLNKAEWRKQK